MEKEGQFTVYLQAAANILGSLFSSGEFVLYVGCVAAAS